MVIGMFASCLSTFEAATVAGCFASITFELDGPNSNSHDEAKMVVEKLSECLQNYFNPPTGAGGNDDEACQMGLITWVTTENSLTFKVYGAAINEL